MIELFTADCIAWMSDQPENHFDLVFGSPPYTDCRTYGIGAQRDCLEWVEWMLQVTEAAARICKGPVVWVAAGCTRKRNYWPAVEGLMWEWFKRGGTHELYRPCVFHRVGIPGSGREDWFRADWEYVACFKKPGALPWADNTACGHPPKWAPGGEMSYRLTNGSRKNQWGHSLDSGATVTQEDERVRSKGKRPSHRDQWGSTGHATGGEGREANGKRKTRPTKLQTRRKADGTRPGRKVITRPAEGQHNNEQDYTEPVLANPGNVIKLNVGGGVMGHKIAHENEAPFPEKLAEFFIRSLCPPGGLVLDPFSGSGTTVSVAQEFGRNAVGIDVRESQTELAKRRVSGGQRSLLT